MASEIGWIPKTKLGKMVLKGEITSMSDALRSGLPLREPEIVDFLLPDLEDEVVDVNMVQRMTDSGRRVNFVITTVVGNGNGFVGLGRCRGKEVGPTIRKCIEIAKKNIFEIRRGCGSWECGCGEPHSLAFRVVGKSGSVEVTLKPAPRGVSLAVGDVAKHILRVAGIKDVWGFTKGHTKTTVNYALATFEALKATSVLKVTEGQKMKLKILSGAQPIYAEAGAEEEAEEAEETEAVEAVEGITEEKTAPEKAKAAETEKKVVKEDEKKVEEKGEKKDTKGAEAKDERKERKEEEKGKQQAERKDETKKGDEK